MPMLYFRGNQAHPHYRIEGLLSRLSDEVPQVNELHSEYVYFANVKGVLTRGQSHALSSLLGLGVDAEIPSEHIDIQGFANSDDLSNQALVLVVPRLGTISPWSAHATNIAENCGFDFINRLERGIAYKIEAIEKLTWGDIQAMSILLYDRMTESIFFSLEEASTLFKISEPKPLLRIDVLKEGISALQNANQRMQLGLSSDELNYFYHYFKTENRNPTDAELMTYAELNSEHSRHKIFNSGWIIDGNLKPQSLFSMIKNTYKHHSRGILSAYHDNGAVLTGNEGMAFFPMMDKEQNLFRYTNQAESLHLVIKVETHNHPTAISPGPGAATGVGGEIRDEGSVGRGAKPKAGLVGFCVSNLRIPGFIQPWEEELDSLKRLASPLAIMQNAPLGAARFANEFGRPTILGYFRCFEQSVQGPFGPEIRGFNKPIMLAGGMGTIRNECVEKAPLKTGMLVVGIGGPAMLVALHSGGLSSFASGLQDEIFDLSCVQRGNAEVQRSAQELINSCQALGSTNPIQAIHDVGAGGLATTIPELIYNSRLGSLLELRNILSADPSLSPLEIWCNEAQERYVIIIKKEDLDIFTFLANRESCPFAVIGEIIETPDLICHDGNVKNIDSRDGRNDKNMDKNTAKEWPIHLPLSFLFEVPRESPRKITRYQNFRNPLKLSGQDIDIYEAATRLLRLPTIADKTFLITINDRTVTGLVARDQMVGPWQVPVADCAVTASDFVGYHGEAMGLGERPALALIDAAASARISVGEAITNIAAANIGTLSDINLSANWMAAMGTDSEDLNLYEAVSALGLEFCPALNLTISVGKDSLSMRSHWSENGLEKEVVSPMTVVISAFARVMDIRKTLTPELLRSRDTLLIFIDLGFGKQRLGGSSLSYVFGELGDDCPDVDDPTCLKAFFNCIQFLNLEGKILSYHDRSDGGLFMTLCEMAFASHIGLQVDVSYLGTDPIVALFNEELGAVIQVKTEDLDLVMDQLKDYGLSHCHVVGWLDEADQISFIFNEEVIFSADRIKLQQLWSETSFVIQSLRDNPRTAKKLFDTLEDREDPGLNVNLSFSLEDLELELMNRSKVENNAILNSENNSKSFINTGAKPKIAILREQGTNGHSEMAAAFHRVGFDAIDVHMNDLKEGRSHLSQFNGLAVCGGFSYGDTLGAGWGFAKRILLHSQLREEFEAFFTRLDSFTLGVGNGAQMLAGLKSIIPGAELWPTFIRNTSEQFESMLSLVEVETSPSILLQGMAGSRIPIPVAHSEGRVQFANDEIQQKAIQRHLVALRFVDSRGRKTKAYPANPNGSPLGITGLTNKDGRITMMMTHPERAFRTVQYSWHPKEWGEVAPWSKVFLNARKWLD